jgi:signal transduction histidine kinase
MRLFSPRQLPLKIVLLLAVFSLVFLNAGGWYLYNLALTALDERTAAQLWSIGRTAALDVEAIGLPELIHLVGEDWPEATLELASERDTTLPSLALLDTLNETGAYLGEVAERNGLQRLVLMDLWGRVLFDSADRVSFGEVEHYLPLDRAEIEAAAQGEEAATVAYPVEGIYYKRAYVPAKRYDQQAGTTSLILGIEAGTSQFREMVALRGHLWGLAVVSTGVATLLMVLVYRTVRKNLALERSTERARRALEMGQMTAAVAHEIRNPLGIIQTNAECLQSLSTDPAAQEAATDILEETKRLASIVRRFTGLSGKDSVERAADDDLIDVDMIAFIEDLFSRHSAGVSGKGATIDLQIPDRSKYFFRVRAREDALSSIFQNLLDNAADAVPDGGKITLRLLRADGMVRVEVEDTGSGMTREEIDAALQPFHTTKERGSGIGLPLAKSLVEKMGGRFALRSRKGLGTRVTVDLPSVGS